MTRYIPNVFSESEHLIIKNYVTNLYSQKDKLGWDEKFNRHFVHNPKPLQKFHLMLESSMSEYYGIKLKKSYCYLAMYGANGVCKRHVDRIQCQYSFDYCLTFDKPWPLFVEDNGKAQRFDLEENSALIYRGTEQFHWREDRKEGDFCHMIFFHFVPIEFEGQLI
jgi:hypothetical protein